MTARLAILVVVAIALAVYFATRTRAPLIDQNFEEFDPAEGGPASAEELRPKLLALNQRSLPGREPPEKPELAIRAEVDRREGKNRLVYDVTELHGYYVESFDITFFYKPKPETTLDDTPLKVTHYRDDFLPANETLHGCIEVVPAELMDVGGDLGRTENWGAVIESHGRSREKNPDPLPEVVRMMRCD